MAADPHAPGEGVMLETHGLTIKRGEVEVLRDITVTLKPGAITAIVGPNGAGKSSLLMALAGLLEPAAGAVLLEGETLSNLAPRERARKIGYLPQNGEIAWDVASEAVVALGRMPHGDARQKPVEAAIAALDLKTLRHRVASQLSGGERARVLLGRVLAGEPRWILADEPLAALDLAHQINLIKHLRQCAEDGAGVVIVIHDLALARNHADHVITLREGRVLADGKPVEALSSSIIAEGWDVQTQWLESAGQHALAALDKG